MTDIAVIGAGMAGLVCAQQLTQAGYSVLVVEKSRGLGGRVATRRLHNTLADHGTCYLKPKGEMLGRFVDLLRQRQILQVWTDKVYDFKDCLKLKPEATCYVAPAGMSACAKFLAQGLQILLNQRAIAIHPTKENQWRLTLEDKLEEITAKSVVVAIPAPQAFMLLQPLEASFPSNFIDKLRAVDFYPSLSVMAGYPATSQPLPEPKAVTFVEDDILGWMGLDSTKRLNSQQPHFVFQSSADFAQGYLDAEELNSPARQMLQRAAEYMQLEWLATPEWMQVHRWRYAFPKNPLESACLSADPLPLVCCGDWCGGNLVEGAMLSGLAAAKEINNQLQQRILPGIDFLDYIAG